VLPEFRSTISFVKELEMSGAEVAKKLNIGNFAVSRFVTRGEQIAKK